jgi:hypothetical protein
MRDAAMLADEIRVVALREAVVIPVVTLIVPVVTSVDTREATVPFPEERLEVLTRVATLIVPVVIREAAMLAEEIRVVALRVPAVIPVVATMVPTVSAVKYTFPAVTSARTEIPVA